MDEYDRYRVPTRPQPVILRARYRSRTNDSGVTYLVYENGEGAILCSCPGFTFTGHCWHVSHESYREEVRDRRDADHRERGRSGAPQAGRPSPDG